LKGAVVRKRSLFGKPPEPSPSAPAIDDGPTYEPEEVG
jgi:hypothetical protein